MDFLGLRNLTIIENTLETINKIHQQEINIDKIPLDDKKTFKFLENLLISDSSEKVRISAALILQNLYLDKALEPMKWALIHVKEG